MTVLTSPAVTGADVLPEVLDVAALWVSDVAYGGLVYDGDLDTALTIAARQVCPELSSVRAHVVADEAKDLLADYLVSEDEIDSGQATSRAIYGWFLDLPGGRTCKYVARKLHCAADRFRLVTEVTA